MTFLPVPDEEKIQSHIRDIEDAIAAIRRRWKAHILVRLAYRSYQLEELENLLTDCPEDTLCHHLSELEEDGLIVKRVIDGRPMYLLTTKGGDLVTILYRLGGWQALSKKKSAPSPSDRLMG